jgi:hypothetical protein
MTIPASVDQPRHAAVLFLTHVQSVCLAQLPIASGLAARRKHGCTGS